MKLLTVIILYTDESKKFIPDIKEMILKKLFSPNEINFVEEYVGEESLKIKNIEQLNKFDSKYLYIVNAEDEVVFLELVLDVLRERDADIVYNDFIILHEDSEKPEISSSDMLLKTYYNKIIKIEYLKKLDEQQEPVYPINAGNKISIRIYNHPDLIMESLVTPDGAIGVMFAGQVQVAGLTLEEASEKIKKIY